MICINIEEKPWDTERTNGAKSFIGSLELPFIIISWLVRVRRGGQRMAMVHMYSTVFPNAEENFSTARRWNELSECGKEGLAVKPKMSDALLFWSMTPNATLDRLNLNAGCSLIKGEKWSSTKWMYAQEY
ncbi:hypothetical protein GQ457_18G025140 [Hibiscus cannabinus]